MTLVIFHPGIKTVGNTGLQGYGERLGLLEGRTMNTKRTKSKHTRRSNGSLLAEMPAGLYLLFIGIGLPLIILASMFTRSFFLYHAAIDSCMKAARARSFTQAQTTVNTVFNNDAATWNGISGTPTFSILVKPIGPGSTQVKTAPLAAGSVQVSQNVYLARVVVAGQVEPLLHIGGGWQGMSIPGLTQPYPLTVAYVSYFENPSGLTN